MRRDLLGNPVTCSAAMLPHVDDFVDGLLRYRTKATSILGVVDRAPDELLPNVIAGMLWMFWERPEAPGRAAPFVARARAAASRGNDRERAHLGVLEAWVAGEGVLAAARAEAILDDHPGDLLALKIAQYHLLNGGDSPGILRTGLKGTHARPENAQAAAMAAFGYEQCHLLDAAQAEAERALTIEPGEPWAHHALAHVLLTRGAFAAGRRLMAAQAPAWEGLNSFMYTHNWWHRALFEISAGDAEAALALWDARVWGVDPDYSQDQAGAVSLLARLEFAGVDAGERWQVLRPYLESRAADTGNAFLTLHYLYGLGRAGSPVAGTLIEAARARAESAPAAEAPMWRDTALPAAEGVLAAAHGDHPRAIRALSAALPTLWQTGGSHAQRDLFEQMLLASLLGAESWVAAQQLLETRRRFDPDGVPLNRTLGHVYDRLGLADAARAARARTGPGPLDRGGTNPHVP